MRRNGNLRQRLRWQSGTLTALRNYGVTPVTRSNWAKEVFFYLRYFSQVACWVIIGTSLAAHPSLQMPPWVIGMLGLIYAERVITVRKAGWRGILLAALPTARLFNSEAISAALW